MPKRPAHLRHGFHPSGLDAFHNDPPFINSRRERDTPAYGGGRRLFQHGHPESAHEQPIGHARPQIPASLHDDDGTRVRHGESSTVQITETLAVSRAEYQAIPRRRPERSPDRRGDPLTRVPRPRLPGISVSVLSSSHVRSGELNACHIFSTTEEAVKPWCRDGQPTASRKADRMPEQGS